jgi:hypothetical protein
MQTATQDSVAVIKEISGTIDRITKIARNDGRAQADPTRQSRGFFFLDQKPVVGDRAGSRSAVIN